MLRAWAVARGDSAAGTDAHVVGVIGAGIAGICVALDLSQRGMAVRLFEANRDVFTRASKCNVGRLHLGFHYPGDPTMETARLLERGARAFVPLLDGWTHGGLADATWSKPYWCFIANDSMISGEEYLRYCHRLEAVNREVARESGMDDPQDRDEPFFRVLERDEYNGIVDASQVELGVATHEIAIEPAVLRDILKRALNASDVELMTDCRVAGIRREHRLFEVEVEVEGVRQEFSCDQVVNAAWANRLSLDDGFGYVPREQWLDRLKALALVDLPPDLAEANSLWFAMGPFSQVTNDGGGLGTVSYMPASIVERSTSIPSPEHWARLEIDGATPDVEAALGRDILQGAARFVPRLADASPRQVEFGVVHCTATTDIDDPASGAHVRSDSGVSSLDLGYHSLNTGKLGLGPLRAAEAARRVREHRPLLEELAASSSRWKASESLPMS